MAKQMMLIWALLITTWVANINDLIRGEWFYIGTEAILFWNMVGIAAFICIVLTYREELKDAKRGK